MNDITITQAHVDAWDYLLARLANVNAVSGIMGYFQARTGFETMYGFYEDGGIAKGLDYDSFIRDKKAYGIGAWDKWYEKAGLWNLSKRSGYGISTLENQLELFYEELKGLTYANLRESLKHVDNPEDAAELMYTLYLPEENRWSKLHNDICEYSHLFYTRFVHPKHTVRYVEITDEEVWAMSRPHFLGKRISKAYKGETYQHITTAKNGKWYSVYYNGQICWIRAKGGVLVEREETYGEHNDSYSA